MSPQPSGGTDRSAPASDTKSLDFLVRLAGDGVTTDVDKVDSSVKVKLFLLCGFTGVDIASSKALTLLEGDDVDIEITPRKLRRVDTGMTLVKCLEVYGQTENLFQEIQLRRKTLL